MTCSLCIRIPPHTTRTKLVMRKIFRDATACLTLALIAGIMVISPQGPLSPQAATANDDSNGEVRLTVRGSGLPVPRFVTLKSDEVNMRAGPGTEYPVLWQYRKEGLPLRVEAEFGVWRKVVDHDETTGWMHHSVLSLKRQALVTASSARIFASPESNAALLAVAERNALIELQSCPTQWCKVTAGEIRGWVSRTALWGLLDGEVLN